MLLWVDGFDHYGTTASHLSDGPYAEVSGTMDISSVQKRTGTHSLIHNGTGSGSPLVLSGIRRVFNNAKTRAGVGYALYLTGMPGLSNKLVLFGFADANGGIQVFIFCTATGAIEARFGSDTGTVLGTSTVLMGTNTWNHIEAAITVSNTVGSLEVRLNGVTVLNLTGIDTQATSLAEVSQVRMEVRGAASVSIHYRDDLFAWDDTGSQNNDFIGDHKVFTLFPVSDTSEAQWDPVTGTEGYPMIDEANPDEDITYISAPAPPTSAPIISQFGIADLGSEISTIAGVYATSRMRKTDAGTCIVLHSMISGSSEALGEEQSITEIYTYWASVFETNPNTGLPWSRSTFNSAELRFSRIS